MDTDCMQYVPLKYFFQFTYYSTDDLGDLSSDLCDVEFPFTLSALSHLEHLTISTVIWAVQEEYACIDEETTYHDFVFYSPIHAIAKLIESSAPSLRQVVLRFFCYDFSNIDSLIEVNWDRLALLAGDPKFPHIDLCISGQESFATRGFSPEEITSTLAQHTRLMQLVDLGVFSIKPETRDIISC